MSDDAARRPEDADRLLDEFLAQHPDGDSRAFEAWLTEHRAAIPGDGWLEVARDALGRLDRGDSSFGPPRSRIEASAGPDPDSSAFLAPGRTVGRFALRRFLGSGGMGQVWEAEDEQLDRLVALKLLLPGRVDESLLERFAREARAGGRLQHPNVVATFDHGHDGGLAWIAQELVPRAWTLADFIDEQRGAGRRGGTYYASVARLAAALADGLHAAHEAEVIHRDVKPANVLIADDDVPRLTDFGLARLEHESSLSVSGEVVGTWAYMSPEQVRGEHAQLDRRTDVFSLGAVLYELLTLHRAFEADGVEGTARRILTEDPTPPDVVRAGCPRDLSLICMKALEKERERRYATAAELAEDLRRHLASEPISARPPSAADRLRRWTRRNPAPATGLAVGAAALVVTTALLVQQIQTSEELGREVAERTRLASVAEEAANDARIAQTEAEAEREDVLRLSARVNAELMLEEQRALWPVSSELIPALEDWIDRATELLEERPRYEAKLAELRSRALPRTEEEREAQRRAHPAFPRLEEIRTTLAGGATDSVDAIEALAPAERAALEAEAERLEAEVGERSSWTFAPEDVELRWWSEQLAELVDVLDSIESDQLDPLAVDAEESWSVAGRLEHAHSLAASAKVHSAAWDTAREPIHTRYEGLDLDPIDGLLPIGPDPDSGLWEFAHLASGEPAERDADGRLTIAPETGAVLVLVPGGIYTTGAQFSDPESPYFDDLPNGPAYTRGLREIELSPYLISKYELTQGQWERMTGATPSWDLVRDGVGMGNFPLNSISWIECVPILARFDLSLPTEAQWEVACRAGTDTPYAFSGPESPEELENESWYERLHGKLNALCADAFETGESWATRYRAVSHRDGAIMDAAVGSFPPNAFGLHEMHGNVAEQCLDRYTTAPYPESDGEPLLDPFVPPGQGGGRVNRGGSYMVPVQPSRSYLRLDLSFTGKSRAGGCRPARPLGEVVDWSKPSQ